MADEEWNRLYVGTVTARAAVAAHWDRLWSITLGPEGETTHEGQGIDWEWIHHDDALRAELKAAEEAFLEYARGAITRK